MTEDTVGFGWRLQVILLLAMAAPVLAAPPHVVVLHHDGSSYNRDVAGQPNVVPRQAAAKAFFASHTDSYDFVVAFPTFPTNLGAGVVGLHSGVRNSVTGVGRPVFDNGALYGSSARLLGYLDIGALVPGAGMSVDDAVGVIAHEVLHQWAAHPTFKDARTASIRKDLLGQEGAHWSFFLDSDGSVLYGSDWKDNGNGTFTAVASRKRYSSLDLYLMGFTSELEVGPMTLLHPTGSGHVAQDVPPADGTVIAATSSTVSITDIVASLGRRSPSSSTAPTEFRAAFVLLLAPGQTPSVAQLAFVEAARVKFANQFFFLSQGRGVMDTGLLEVAPGAVASNPGVVSGLNALFALQKPTGEWEDDPRTALRDTQAALEAVSLFTTDLRAAPARTSAGAFLETAALDGTDATSRRILGLLAAGKPLGAALDGFKQLDDGVRMGASGGFGYTSGYAPTLIDTALAGVALLAGGRPAVELATLSAYVLTQQRPDGGWAFALGGPSRIAPTCIALALLDGMPHSEAVQTAANHAFGFLRARRQADGSFRDDLSSTGATSQALIALAKWRQLQQVEASQGAAVLLASQRPDGSWGGSAYQTALAIRALTATLETNLAIDATSISLTSSSVIDAEPVLATVVVRNEGFVPKANVSVRAYDSSGVPFGPLTTVGAIAAGGVGIATLTLDTTGHEGSSQVFVVVDPDGVIDESTESDNRAVATLVVRPASVLPDLFAAQGTLGLTPSQLSRLPTSVTATVMVGNVGLTAVSQVPVELKIGGTTVAMALVDLGARSSQQVTLTATIASAPASAIVTVAVNPQGAVTESDTSNNSVALVWPVVLSVDIGVAAVSAAPSLLDQGSDLQITYELSNHGLIATSNVQVAIAVLDVNGADVGGLPLTSLTVAAGNSQTFNTQWRANTSGTHSIVVRATAAGDTTTANDVGQTTVTVTGSPRANLTVLAKDLTLSPDPAHQNRPAIATAKVTNNGGGHSGPFAVELFQGTSLSSATLLSRQTSTGIAAGGTTSFTVSLTPATTDATALLVIVDPDAAVTEFDETDNTTVRPFTPLGIPDLVVADADVLPATLFPRANQQVPVVVSVFNKGGQTATNVSVELFDGDPSNAGVAIGTMTIASLGAATRQDVSFMWSTAGLSGTHVLIGSVNRAGAFPEARIDNNTGRRTLQVQDGALALSNPYFSPNGDGVKDTTELFFRLASAAPLTLTIRDELQKQVRELSVSSLGVTGSTVWDGRDDLGRVVLDGQYTFTGTVGPDGGQTLLGTVVAVVDTNRYPVYRSVGTPLLSLESVAEGAGPPTAFPPGDRVVFAASLPGRFGDPVPGFYSREIGSEATTLLTPLTWTSDDLGDDRLSVSPDGKTIANVIVAADRPTIRLFDVSTKASRNLVSNSYLPELSPDGSKVMFHGDGLEVIDVAGTNRRMIAQE